MIDDAELLQSYVRTGDESAFTAIVERHKGLVYGSALRQTNHPDLAEEITQAVFIVLARKASTIKPNVVLSGWLFRATRFIASDAMKAEHRRLNREQASLAGSDDAIPASAGSSDNLWSEIAPALDEALTRLGDKDRDALLLRFFEQKNLSEVGRSLGIGEDGARKRVERALEKLRTSLSRRGVAISATMLASALMANAVPSAPATITAGAVLASASTASPMVKGAIAFMAWSKTKIALTATVTLLAINTGVLITVLMVQQHRQRGYEVVRPGSQMLAATEAGNTNEFVSLFNGVNLDGWRYNPDVWYVRDGHIIGRVKTPEVGMQNHCLIWAGGDVDDFELHIKFRITEEANSGVSFRGVETYGNIRGYQAEIEGARTGLFVIGGPGRERRLSRAGWRTIAGEQDGQDTLEQFEEIAQPAEIAQARQAVQRGEWCDYSVFAQGTHVVIVLNGVKITDTRDDHPGKFVPRGKLGLEYTHNPEQADAVEFKEIRFRRLGSSTSQ